MSPLGAVRALATAVCDQTLPEVMGLLHRLLVSTRCCSWPSPRQLHEGHLRMKPVHFSTGQWLVPQGSCYVHLDLLLWEPAGICTNTLKTLKPDPLATRCQALSDFDWLTLPLSFPELAGPSLSGDRWKLGTQQLPAATQRPPAQNRPVPSTPRPPPHPVSLCDSGKQCSQGGSLLSMRALVHLSGLKTSKGP